MNDLPWIIGFMSIYLCIQGYYKKTIQYLLIICTLFLIQYGISHVNVNILTFIGFTTFIVLRFMPVFMGAYSLGRVPSGKLIAALQRIRLPMGILITLAVSSRFMPVIRLEFDAIQVSAKLRGVSITSPKNWLRPLSTFEYTIVPLLMRSLKISDELAASATTKGIDFPGKKTSIYPLAFKWYDLAVLLIYIGWLFVFIRYGG